MVFYSCKLITKYQGQSQRFGLLDEAFPAQLQGKITPEKWSENCALIAKETKRIVKKREYLMIGMACTIILIPCLSCVDYNYDEKVGNQLKKFVSNFSDPDFLVWEVQCVTPEINGAKMHGSCNVALTVYTPNDRQEVKGAFGGMGMDVQSMLNKMQQQVGQQEQMYAQKGQKAHEQAQRARKLQESSQQMQGSQLQRQSTDQVFGDTSQINVSMVQDTAGVEPLSYENNFASNKKSNFCGNCGTKAAGKFCGNCGTQIL